MVSPLLVSFLFGLFFAALLILSTLLSVNTPTAKFMISKLIPEKRKTYISRLVCQIILDIVMALLYGLSINYYFCGLIFITIICFFKEEWIYIDEKEARGFPSPAKVTLDELNYMQMVRVSNLTIHKIQHFFSQDNYAIRYDISEEIKDFSWDFEELELEPNKLYYHFHHNIYYQCKKAEAKFAKKQKSYKGDIKFQAHCTYGLLSQNRMFVILPFTRAEAEKMPYVEYSIGNAITGRLILTWLSDLLYGCEKTEYDDTPSRIMNVSENPEEYKYKPSNEAAYPQFIKVKGLSEQQSDIYMGGPQETNEVEQQADIYMGGPQATDEV